MVDRADLRAGVNIACGGRMVFPVRALLALGVFGLVGCGVGGSDGGTTPDAPQAPPQDSAEVLPLCTAQVALSGTFTAAAALDPAGGCQPQGTWAVTATVSDKGTCTTVPLKAEYSYALSGTGRDTKIAYTKASGEEFQGNVQATGSGGCEGSFEHIQTDGNNFDQVNLHAFLPKPMAADTELAITGTAEFRLWSSHP
jgi:hypothetical protein